MTQIPLSREHRLHPRQRIRLRMGKIADIDDRFLSECTIRDLSRGGARLVVSKNVDVPDLIVLFDELEKTIALAIVRWRRGNELGIRYDGAPAKLKHFRSPRLRSLAQRYYAVPE